MSQSAEHTTTDIALAVAARRDAGSVALAGAGTEFLFYEAAGGLVREGYRIPRSREFNTVNNNGVPAGLLQRQEMALARWAADNGVPSAAAIDLTIQDSIPVLILEVLDDDGSELDSAALGSVVASMHGLPVPDFPLVAQAGRPWDDRIVHRLEERYARLRIRHSLPVLPPTATLQAILDAGGHEVCLIHMDLRRQNVRVQKGQLLSIFDWSNALAAPPELEIARIQEYAVIKENGIDYPAFLKGYSKAGGSIDVGGPCWTIFGLDAAVMLAGVFDSVAPDPELREHFLSRVRTLAGDL
ncbi:phosphotransferase [Paenarthrobacter sp. CM16]|uniref:phosphotransferase n=1 Tax=Paenarthrobacter sp. CM16 TaxID=2738447 RepID=UPI001555D64C|nr:phosphotransferase [Paenarthrobacter sp. CM16]NQD86667.1 phosphotransferase [Paenarthrobacter sp. CM16]